MAIGAGFPEVLAGARQGDPSSMRALYRDLAPAVLGYLRGQGCPDAEDAASEVFVGLVRGLPRFRGDEGDFRRWVFSIAHRRMVDERRRVARRREQPLDPSELAARTALHPVGDTESDAMDRAGRDWAIQELGSLTEDQRAVLLLRVLADLPVADVARILGRSLGAVKALQGRALASLARRIQREGVT
jgi:RNA polymerase sigma factor (sigma-70 family)